MLIKREKNKKNGDWTERKRRVTRDDRAMKQTVRGE